MFTSAADFYLTRHRPSPIGLRVLHAGEQNCPPGYSFGYMTRGHYLLHYIVDGCGEYRVGQKIFQLKKGDGFLILPGVSTFYRALQDNPWSYRWVGFEGEAAEGLLSQSQLGADRLIFHYEADDFIVRCLENLEESCKTASGGDMERCGYLLLLLDRLRGRNASAEAVSKPEGNNLFDKAVRYIQDNYSRNIRVTDIARSIGVERSYLYRIFMYEAHCSPGEYLSGYRLDNAAIRILSTELSFANVASSVGFEYSSHFYRRFKQRFGVTPSEFKTRFRAEERV